MDSKTIQVTLNSWSAAVYIMRAYMFIDATKKTVWKIVAELRRKPGVLVTDVINGPHPVIACIEADNPASMAQTILFDIRNIEGVKDLTVYLSMDGQDTTMSDSFIDNILPDLPINIIARTDNRRRKRNRNPNDE